MVETSVGATFVRRIGKGPKVFVIHGGPGFDHGYLWPALKELARRRSLIFYDQIGCGRSLAPEAPVTGEMTFSQFVELREQLARDEPVGVFAHSWGALVVVASAGATNAVPFSEGVFVTPMPLTSAEFEMCRNNLFRRIPAETMAEFERMNAAHADGDSLVHLLLPYYLGPSPAMLPDIHFTSATFNAVIGSLGEFDFRSGLQAVGHFNVVLGEMDFTTANLVKEMLEAAGQVRVMSRVGHFPFCEYPATFAEHLAEFFPG